MMSKPLNMVPWVQVQSTDERCKSRKYDEPRNTEIMLVYDVILT